MKKKKLLSLALAAAMLFGSAAALPEGVFTESASITASAEELYPPSLNLPKLSGDKKKDIISIALSQEGYVASDTNLSEYWVWAGGVGSSHGWCTEFVCWCAEKAGIDHSIIPIKWGSNGLREFFAENNQYYSIEGGCSDYTCGCVDQSKRTIKFEEIQPGDILLVDTNDNMNDGPDHTALVCSTYNDYIYTIDGNVGGTYSNGKKIGFGKVEYKRRNTDSIRKFHGICRPNYNEISMSKTSITLSKTSYTYDGKAKKPTVTVVLGTKALVNGTDYTVAYKNNVKAGTATVTVTGKGNYSGTVSKTFKIVGKSISDATVKLSKASYTYDGKAKKPTVTVVLGTKALVNGTDYTVAYKNNVKAGTATVTVTGKGNYSGTVSKTFKIVGKSISNATVKLSKTTYTYDGKAKKPTVTVVLGTKTLVNGTDYTVAYKNNVKAGTATVTVTGKGNYSGSLKANFKIKNRTASDIKKTRLAGDNRYSTATKLSGTMYKTANTVILVTGLSYQDALVAVPLASAYNAPLLLGTERHITAQTEAELKRLKAKNVIVVSTNGAIGTKAKAELKALKLNVTYIEGKTCFETAAKVAKALQTKTKKAPDTIFFATDSSFADALTASPVAAIKNAPIIYLKNKGSIDSATAAYLKSVKGKVKNAYVIGGDGVISDAMMKNVATALGLKVGSTVQRVAGANRYETCVAVNKKFKSVVSSDGICVAKGLDFPDALAGGVYAAATKQALFLADGKKLQDCQNTYLKSKNAGKITVFGGTGAVPDDLVKLIAQASV